VRYFAGVYGVKRAFVVAGLALLAIASVAQEAEDGVIGTCVDQGNAPDVCICASLLLHARLGDQNYVRFGEISDRIAAIDAGAEAEEGEMSALTGEGYRFFIPHGQSIAVCKENISASG